jgi:hypothetical protein
MFGSPNYPEQQIEALRLRRSDAAPIPPNAVPASARFQGLLKDARSGGPLHRVDKKKHGGAILLPYLGKLGANGHRMISFPYPVFEQAVLRLLAEVDPDEVVGNGEADNVQELTGRLAEVEGRIRSLQDALLGGDVQAAVGPGLLWKVTCQAAPSRPMLSNTASGALSHVRGHWIGGLPYQGPERSR